MEQRPWLLLLGEPFAIPTGWEPPPGPGCCLSWQSPLGVSLPTLSHCLLQPGWKQGPLGHLHQP